MEIVMYHQKIICVRYLEIGPIMTKRMLFITSSGAHMHLIIVVELAQQMIPQISEFAHIIIIPIIIVGSRITQKLCIKKVAMSSLV